MTSVLAGVAIAVTSGLLGWFVVLRRQVFAGDALGHVALPGALAAAVLGVDVRLGLLVATVGLGCLLALLGERARADDVTIGSTFALVLGAGVFLLARLAAESGRGGAPARRAEDGAAAARSLFGSIVGIGRADALVATAVAGGVAVAVVAIARPLLVASLDPDRAAARGVPVRLLGFVFLGLLGAAAGQAGQAVGALLALGLLVAPAAAAHLLTRRPFLGLTLSAAIAAVSTLAGLGISAVAAGVPGSAAVILCACLAYGAAALLGRLGRAPVSRSAGRRRPPSSRCSAGTPPGAGSGARRWSRPAGPRAR